MKDKIFISYRRGDAAAFAALLNARLRERFGPDRVFIDVDSIGPGVDFIDSIAKAVSASAIMLVLIGGRWNPERLRNPRDLVRLEMMSALEQGTWIIPVLLEDVEMPRQEELPEEFISLIRRNAVEISTPRMNLDIRRLIDEIAEIFTTLGERKMATPSPSISPSQDPPPPLPLLVHLPAPPTNPEAPPAVSGKSRSPWKFIVLGTAIFAVILLLSIPGLRRQLFPQKNASGPKAEATEEAASKGLVASITGMTLRTRAFTEKHLRERGLPDLGSGLEVADLYPDGPAERAGVVKGDIVRKLDGRLLKSSNDFVEEIRRRRPGQSVTLEVWRGAQFLDVSVPVENGFELYQYRCDSGQPEGCSYLGNLYQFDAKDLARASALFRSACDGGYVKACTDLGVMYENGNGMPKDPVNAAALYERACDGKDGVGCNSLGSLFERGVGRNKDLSRAVALYHQGCSLQAFWGCTQLGIISETGSDTEKNPTQAALYYEQACDGGEAYGCACLGYLASAGIGVPKDPFRAATLYRVACDGGSIDGCLSLGVSYENGAGVEKDLTRAVALYQQVCEASVGAGCLYLGKLYYNGRGLEKDLKRSADLFQRGCDLSWQDSCNSLGLLYGNGEGVGKDMSRAISLFRAACEGGSASACNNLGVQYVLGEALEKDLARGVSLYQQSCDGDIAVACSNLGSLYQLGQGVTKDLQKAAELYRKACRLGNSGACTALNSLGAS